MRTPEVQDIDLFPHSGPLYFRMGSESQYVSLREIISLLYTHPFARNQSTVSRNVSSTGRK
jgi:hypothetical protein